MKKIFLSAILAVALNGADDSMIDKFSKEHDSTTVILDNFNEYDMKSMHYYGITFRFDKRKMVTDGEGNPLPNIDYTAIKVELHDSNKRYLELMDKGDFVEIRAKTKAKIKVKDSSGKIKQIQ